MHVESIRTLDGPNVFHRKPVLSLYLRLGDLTDVNSDEVPGFNERLIAALPGLKDHHCSRGYIGGFCERLRLGTYFGHVTEHVALELAGLLGSAVTYGKTRYAGEPGLYQVLVRYQSEAAMRSLLHSAVRFVDAVVAGEPFDLAEHLARARSAAQDGELGPSTRSIVDAAARRGIPWRRLNEHNLVQLGQGRYRRLIQAAVTDRTSHIALEVASDKALTKRMLHDAGIPVPHGEVVASVDEALAAFDRLGAPVVVKPLDGNQGRGITLDVHDTTDVEAAYTRAAEVAQQVIVEQQVEGDDYRVLVVNGAVVAASRRVPCHVVGDGASSLRELIDQANRDPLRGAGHEKPLTRIVIDDEVRLHLQRAGVDMDTVPLPGASVTLRGCANLSTGATAEDATDRLGPAARELCERAAAVIGLDVCGIDLVTPRVEGEPDGGFKGGIVEVNAGPGLRMHLHPTAGTPRDVGDSIVTMLYPDGAPSRVPLCSVTGTNGKTTVTRMVGHVLNQAGVTAGVTSTDGMYVGGRRVSRGDHTGPASARAILADTRVEAAVLETARGGILRRGLGYDWSDVAVITNVTRDHIGQDGIETLDDLLWIKSLVAERVRDGGTLILNAEDEGSASMAQRAGVDAARLALVYVALDPDNELLTAHLAAGGRGYLRRDGWLIESDGGHEHRVAHVSAVPATFEGAADHQVFNCLAAAAAARAMGRTVTEVAKALGTFDGVTHNPGRASLFALGDGYVMVDYGHNPAAFTATGALARRWHGELIGIVGVPGDREDAVIEEAAVAAVTAFDRVVIREDADRRGRSAGEVPAIMRRAMLEADPRARVEVVDDELHALRSLLPEVAGGALVVIFYEHLEPIAALVTEAGGTAVSGTGPFAGTGKLMARAQRLLARTQPPKRAGGYGPHEPGPEAAITAVEPVAESVASGSRVGG